MPELRGLFERLFRVVRKEDSSRPVSYATIDCENDLNFDLCDLICLNIYPGWYSRDTEVDKPIFEIPERLQECITALKKMGQADKPLLLSEIGAGAIYGWRDPYNNRWTEGYQKEYLKTVLENFKENKEINGVLLWQFCDGRTYASANCLIRPRAFNNKGLLDEYRRPKEAYDTVKELYNSIK